MTCLSDDQLAGLVLKPIEDSKDDVHLHGCASCQARLLAMRSLANQLTEAHARFDTGHEESRTRLLAALPAAPRPASISIGTQFAGWIGALTVKQRLALTGAFGVVLLAFVAFWGSLAANRLPAMEKMAESVRQAKSYTMTMTFELKYNSKPDEVNRPLVTAKGTSKVFWLAPNSVRMDDNGFDGRNSTTIRPAGKPGIEIDHKAKKYWRMSATRECATPLMVVDKLGDFSGNADRKLGEKQINGKQAWGFEIDGLKVDPEAYPGPVEIWIDSETSLPLFVHYDMKSPVVPAMSVTMEEFQWNIDPDPKLFETEAPAGYVQGTSNAKRITAEALLKKVTLALRTYADLCGGHYPRITRTFAEPVRDEMYQAASISYPPTTKQMQSKDYQKLLDAEGGFAELNATVMMSVDGDAAYYGKTVGPNDKDKVLLRWKRDDGKYQVIFGDLHSETATRAEVRALEKAAP
jgi:outer membrane lipoprotein-sorting protein